MLDLERQFVRQIIAHRSGINALSIIKYFMDWKKSQQNGHTPIIDRIPWMTFESISLIEKRIKAGSNVFEYGGGGSTLYLLDRGVQVVTVEHDKDWFGMLSEIVARDNLVKLWKGIYSPPEEENSCGDISYSCPNSYRSSSSYFIGKTFRRYVETIHQFPDGHFDIVIIDGRARPSCVKQAVPKVKIAGCLVLDNTERDDYLTPETLDCLEKFKRILDRFGPSPYVDFFTRTTVWVRLG